MNLQTSEAASKAEISPHFIRTQAPPFDPKRLATSRIRAKFGLSPTLACAVVELAQLGGRA